MEDNLFNSYLKNGLHRSGWRKFPARFNRYLYVHSRYSNSSPYVADKNPAEIALDNVKRCKLKANEARRKRNSLEARLKLAKHRKRQLKTHILMATLDAKEARMEYDDWKEAYSAFMVTWECH